MDAGWWQVDYKGVGGIAESGGVVNALLMLVGEAMKGGSNASVGFAWKYQHEKNVHKQVEVD